MISIDVTNTTIYALWGKCSSGKIDIQGMAQKPLSGYVKSDGSSDRQGFANDLKALLSPEIRDNNVTIQFSESSVISSQYEFPYEKKPSSMMNIVRSGITQNTQDHIMDYAILNIYPKDGSRFCTVQVYLTPRRLVEFAYEAITIAGKKPCGFQVAENCLYNLQHTGDGFGYRNIILAGMGSARVNITLLTDIQRALTRSSPVMPEAEAFSKTLSGIYNKSAAISAASEQLSKMVQYQSIKEPSHPVDYIYIFGDYATEKAAQEISTALGTPVALLRTPDYISAPNGFSFEKYVHAAGALIEK
ncbi:hypothetical protein LJC56_00775 [Christensenellaceae bacterium OttesenSCG-928-K19]|nr:hypothetical protein [Christensenellaceae bacterium OttesenSCG-928-K19]